MLRSGAETHCYIYVCAEAANRLRLAHKGSARFASFQLVPIAAPGNLISVLGDDSAICILDPSLVAPERRSELAQIILRRREPTLLYTSLEGPITKFAAQVGVSTIVDVVFLDVESKPDELRQRMERAIDGSIEARIARALIPYLDPLAIGNCTGTLGRVLRLCYDDKIRFTKDLPGEDSITRRTFEHHLGTCGIHSLHDLVLGVWLIKAYPLFIAEEWSFARIARWMGYSSKWPLAKRAQEVLGLSADELREPRSIDEWIHRFVTHLQCEP